LSAQGGTREFNVDALADALLNPRERAFSVPQVFDFLERSELSLGRWYWQAAYLPQCGSISLTPHAARLAALPEREQYAAMELWRGLMGNHSFIAYRNDAEPSRSNAASHKNFPLYVPVRLPWTVCLQQSLPPGAAGVLVNQTHLFQDLFMIINPQEKPIFDAIDGRRNIAEILASVNEIDTDATRDFFEQLWRLDQLVFDKSQVT